jgi:hypothetical protein
MLVDSSTGAITVTAPTANPAQGETFTVKDVGNNASVNNITIAPTGTDTIDNGTITTNGGSKTWMTDGQGTWRLISVV